MKEDNPGAQWDEAGPATKSPGHLQGILARAIAHMLALSWLFCKKLSLNPCPPYEARTIIFTLIMKELRLGEDK